MTDLHMGELFINIKFHYHTSNFKDTQKKILVFFTVFNHDIEDNRDPF